ncbi:hypothetical protein IW15_19355 [Chryseobacterium soli]|uniref:Uncharacterized protein n=1 Tax=Chryseobacterium soli TaxID=445961 RepID=A0A086A1D4_9FLAO|nr:hypothetical protein [Chryseobacterium soli]KFF10498.1 hypothetical protein IW15_19355 [Chryseobacterium soli]
MKEIIEYTNSEDFKFIGNLVMYNLNYNILHSYIEIDIQTELNEEIKKWKILAKNPIKIGFFEAYNFVNYREITLMDKHPLLYSVCGNSVICTLEGIPINKFSFIGDLCVEIENITGNWLTVNEIISGFKNLFEKKDPQGRFEEFSVNNDEEILSFPKFLFETIKTVCEKHSIIIKYVEEINNAFNYQNQILLFGNEIITGKNDFFLNQPHIIAEEFELI